MGLDWWCDETRRLKIFIFPALRLQPQLLALSKLQNINNSPIRNLLLLALKVPILQFPGPHKMCDILELFPTKFVTFCNFFPGSGVQLVPGSALPCREFQKFYFRQNFDVLSPSCLAYFQSCAFFFSPKIKLFYLARDSAGPKLSWNKIKIFT